MPHLLPLWMSFAVASTATVLAIAVGVPLAWLLAKSRFRFSSVVEVIVLLPMVLPPTVIGYYLLLVFGREGTFGRLFESITGSPLVFTPVAAVVATFVAAAPFLVRSSQGGFEQVDTAFEDAARTLGHSEPNIFLRVSIPLAWRGILAGIALCFARAMGEFGATLMLAGNIPGRTQTASMAVYDAVQGGNLELALTLSIMLSVTSAAALWLLTNVARTRNTDREHRGRANRK